MSEHVIQQLDDFVDGHLPPAEQVRVESHLAACAACRTAEQQLRELLSAAQQLTAAIDPPAEVWARVRARTIDLHLHRRQMLWSLRYPLAAAAVVLIVLSATLTAVLLKPAAAPQVALSERSIQIALTAADREYDRIARELESTLASRTPALDSATARLVRENLLIIDGAIADARAALERNPDNPGLSRLISTSYQRKIQILERTLRLSARS
ncbi:MAG: anti-sigma factor family protein [Longimicrobiales bacterium]